MTIRGFLMASLVSLVMGGCSFTFAGGQGTTPANAYGYNWSNGPGKSIYPSDVGQSDGVGKPIHHTTPKATQSDPPQRTKPSVEPTAPQRDKPTKPPVRKPAPHRVKPTKPGDTRPDPGDAPSDKPTLQPAPTGGSRPTREPKDSKPDKPAHKPTLQPAPTGSSRPTRRPKAKPATKPTLQPQRAVIHTASIR